MGSIKKKVIIISILIALFTICSFCIYKYRVYSQKIYLKTIELLNYNKDNNTIDIIIKGSSLKNYNCQVKNEYNTFESTSQNNQCQFNLPINKDYEIVLYNNKFKTSKTLLTDHIDNVLTFEFSEKTIYLAISEEYNFNYQSAFIDKEKANYEFTVKDPTLISVENNSIKALKPGTTTLKSNYLQKELTIIITSLYQKAEYKTKKETLACNRYTKEESELLDNVLEFKINSAGYATRGAAVAAARFLTLEFEYRIPYFYENGRVSDSGVRKADGEGRYYKKGLYLHENKFKDITVSYKGPAIWGCELTNLETDPTYGYYPGLTHPNGLDCSGFVSWALKNAGFDPGDNGAGENPEIDNQMTDLGKFTHLDYELINSGKIKPGDLANFWGHIAMIIGIDDEGNFYVAESLQNYYGVVAKKYTPSQLINMFDDVVLMDEYYKEEGIYQNWI